MMKWVWAFFLTTQVHAFTLNNNFGASFKNNKVNVFVAGNTTCPGIFSAEELQALITPAVDKFWNTVPTSALRLKNAGFTEDIPGINEDRLCAPTDETCILQAGGPVIQPVNGIVIACNDNVENFGGASNSSGVLAVTVPNNFSGRKITGAVILLNKTNNSVFKNLPQSQRISVLAHEIGHAIGLGHAEDDQSEALMYYRTVDHRDRLSQDDVDGVSYLYPVHLDKYGCALFGGTTGSGPKGDPHLWQMIATLGLLIAVMEIIKLFKRPKTCATA